MLTFHDSSDDVVAATVSDRITSADLDALVARLEDRLGRYPQVHVFIETQSIDGLQIAGLGAHIARAMPMLGRLGQFGRVAVVSDQAWIRGLARVESAMLPFVSYRVFEPAQSGEALAWVKNGRVMH